MMKVFLVDDQKISNYINKRIIESCNFNGEIICYENPEKALNDLENLQPDFVLLDINMPEIDGWKFLELMSLKSTCVAIKVIMVTSSTSPLDKLKSEEYPQVVDYLIKPLSRDLVINLMGNSCG